MERQGWEQLEPGHKVHVSDGEIKQMDKYTEKETHHTEWRINPALLEKSMRVLLHTVSIAKLWNQPKCPSSGVRADKTGCMYTMEYYLII